MALLPPELVRQVTECFFVDANQRWSDCLKWLRPFSCLRLVCSQVKADAHAAWPGGLVWLANNVARALLRSDRAAETFQQCLREGSRLLHETMSLALFRVLFDRSRNSPTNKRILQTLKLAHDQLWFARVQHLVGHAHSLALLTLDLDDAPFALRELRLSHLRLRKLDLRKVVKQSLVGLDLSLMGTLEDLRVAGVDSDELPDAQVVGFRLPPRVESVKLRMQFSFEEILALQLERIDSLRHLDLSDNDMPPSFPSMPALTECILHNAAVNDAFLYSLSTSESLESLDVSGNTHITSASPLRLNMASSLIRLNVSETSIRDPTTFDLKTNRALRHLIAETCEFTSLAFGLTTNHTLRELSLAGCRGLNAALMQQLAGELACNQCLLKLNLRACSLKDGVIMHFRLEQGSGLQELNLSRNPFSEKGLQPLVGSIKENTVLRHLDLRNCFRGAEAFAAQLARPARLQVVR